MRYPPGCAVSPGCARTRRRCPQDAVSPDTVLKMLCPRIRCPVSPDTVLKMLCPRIRPPGYVPQDAVSPDTPARCCVPGYARAQDAVSPDTPPRIRPARCCVPGYARKMLCPRIRQDAVSPDTPGYARVPGYARIREMLLCPATWRRDLAQVAAVFQDGLVVTAASYKPNGGSRELCFRAALMSAHSLVRS